MVVPLVRRPTNRGFTLHRPTRLVSLAAGVVAVIAMAGCTDASEAASTDDRPLQPLVYTETPERSPQAEAARERRLMSELLRGARADGGAWGAMQVETRDRPTPPTSVRELGETLFDAIVKDDDTAWRRSFIGPRNYASLVEVTLEKARRFVDEQRAESLSTREAFRAERPSEALPEGLSSLLSYTRLELGDDRALDGSLADDDTTIVQHWNNRLYLSVDGEAIELYVRIPKIIRVPEEEVARGPDGEHVYGVGSDLALGPRLRAFLRTGMHLKPKLLDSAEYPIPIDVGNFWRYERRIESTSDANPETSESERASKKLDATRVTLKVESIDRFGARRLVGLQWLYNDPDLTRSEEHWLITPRRIYVCPGPCQRRVDDLDWLLNFLREETAILRFPLHEGNRWGGDSKARRDRFEIGERRDSLELPAGAFFGTYRIEGTGRLHDRIPFGTVRDLRRQIAPGTGIVRRWYQYVGASDDRIVETLTDYRLMSH